MCYMSLMLFCPGNLELLQAHRNMTVVLGVRFYFILRQFGTLGLQMFV